MVLSHQYKKFTLRINVQALLLARLDKILIREESKDPESKQALEVVEDKINNTLRNLDKNKSNSC